MSFYRVPDELILRIMDNDFLKNKDMVNLIKSCKLFNKLGNTFGYLKTVRVNADTAHNDYIRFVLYRNIFLKNLIIDGIDEPTKCMPKKWPEEMIFNSCEMGTTYIDPDVSPTKVLAIRDSHRYKHTSRKDPKRIHINWAKFPELKVLDVYCSDISFFEIGKHCKKLEAIRIDLLNRENHYENSLFLNSIAKLPNLRVIATNCKIYEPLHFVSTKLEVCWFAGLNNTKFTSKSTIVPRSHLKGNSDYLNIQCLCMFVSKYLYQN